MEVKRGETLLVYLNPATGSEQGGRRPVVVIQNDVGNKYSPTIIVASITSQLSKTNLPTHVDIKNYEECGLDKPSIILLEQVETIDKCRIVKRLSKVDEETLKKINIAIQVSMGCK